MEGSGGSIGWSLHTIWNQRFELPEGRRRRVKNEKQRKRIMVAVPVLAFSHFPLIDEKISALGL